MYLPEETLLAKYVIKTHYIMKVIAVYPATQTVDLVEDVHRFINSPIPYTTVVNELGNAVDVGLAKRRQLLNIPVKQERWGQFAIQCNPAVGDTGYIEIMTNDIRDWLENGSNSVPLTDTHFDERSCVFVPFVQNATNKQATYPADNTQLVIKSDHLSITMTDEPDPQPGTQSTPTRNISVVGDINISGTVAITGDVTIAGKIHASGDIESDSDVKAGTVSLKEHTHDGSTLTTTATVGTGPAGTISGNTKKPNA